MAWTGGYNVNSGAANVFTMSSCTSSATRFPTPAGLLRLPGMSKLGVVLETQVEAARGER